MSCRINIINNGGLGTGQWFLNGGPGFPIYLGVSETEGGPYAYQDYYNLDSIGIDNDFWIDFSQMISPPLMVPPISYPTSYNFTYVVGGGTPADCAGEACVGCANFVIAILEPPAAIPPVDVCNVNSSIQNLFDLVGLTCELPDGYSVVCDGPPACDGFDLNILNCPGTYGDFIPQLIPVGTYNFKFTKRNASSDCEDCSTTLALTIFEGPCIGEAQTAFICKPLIDCP